MWVVPIHAFRKCSICGIPSDSHHDSPRECLRAIDLELRQLTRRIHTLTRQRGVVLANWLNDAKVSAVTEEQQLPSRGQVRERGNDRHQKIVAVGSRRPQL